MRIKILLGLVLSLLLANNVMAQSNSGGQSGEQAGQVTRVTRGAEGSKAPRHGNVRPGRPSAQSVPELDGSMAFLALGLTFAVGALIREKRRTK